MPDCHIKQVPPSKQIDAMHAAVNINAANAVVLTSGLVLAVQHLAVLTGKYWGSAGVNLGVYFLDTQDVGIKNKILLYANKWRTEGKANVAFKESSYGASDVRIARQRGDGYWSYLGTDIRQIPGNEATMNLDSFSLSTPDSEYSRVVPHEFGHTCGYPHEHQRKQIVALLDRPATIAYFADHYGWSEAETVQQVFVPLEEASIRGTPNADDTSIMCYDFPGEITKTGKPIPGGMRINATDAAFAAKLYPLSIEPPPPPPPPGTSELKAKIDAVFAAAIAQAARLPVVGKAVVKALQAVQKQVDLILLQYKATRWTAGAMPPSVIAIIDTAITLTEDEYPQWKGLLEIARKLLLPYLAKL